MDKKTQGAWLLHHGKKLQVTTNQDFDAIAFSSKAGTLLSAISGEVQGVVTQERLEALARANHISPKTEMPTIVAELQRQRLLLPGHGGVEVLGLTGHSVLEHTARIFDESDHELHEEVVLHIADMASESPTTDISAVELLSDQFKLPNQNVRDTLVLAGSLGFFDSEPISNKENLLFNGHLFRRVDAHKINGVLSSLKPAEAVLMREATAKLQDVGCLPLAAVTKILSDDLFARLHSIGLFDVSVVGNDKGKSHFVTRPAAFSKFSDSIADDALDLAKAFVASLTYGMTVSSYYRGRIQMISALMNKLINGHSVGPATAIGNDYQALEHKGVVKVSPTNGGMFTMKLLKPEVGRLALAVIQEGDITGQTINSLPGARVTEYIAPEENREFQRKNSSEAVRLNTRKLLQEIRTGGLKK